MNQILRWFTKKETLFVRLIIFLTGLWCFLIPFGKGEQAPAALLAIMGLSALIRTRGVCAQTSAAKGFLLLLTLYLIPIAISLIDAVSFSAPFVVLMTGIGSGLAGLAIIHAIESDRRVLQQITLVLACVVGFWFLDAGIQAIFGRDIFGLAWEQRLSGPWMKKMQMGCYSGPFSALLLIFAMQKRWKPILLWILFLFVSIIVLLNNSRGGWVMYAVVAPVFGWRAFIAKLRHRSLISAGLIAAGIVMIIGLYFSSSTFKARADQSLIALQGDKQAFNEASSERLPIWVAACRIIQAHPINGVGARNFRKVAPDYWPTDIETVLTNATYPHQYVLEYAVGTGLVGILGFIVSAFFCVRWWRQANAKQRQDAFGFGLTLLALYFPLNTHKAYFSSELAVSLWILIALYVAAMRHQKT